jgi:homeobox-leucine zipper protein
MFFCLFSFFKECPHPDDKQRKELSRELGLEPLQVKFWFQNKRTQMKVNDLTNLEDKVFFS